MTPKKQCLFKKDCIRGWQAFLSSRSEHKTLASEKNIKFQENKKTIEVVHVTFRG